jgi:hypothetical protein
MDRTKHSAYETPALKPLPLSVTGSRDCHVPVVGRTRLDMTVAHKPTPGTDAGEERKDDEKPGDDYPFAARGLRSGVDR